MAQKSKQPKRDVDEGIDAPLVSAAMRKIVNGEALTREERSALRRHEKRKEEEERWTYYRSIPKKHWLAMSGRAARTIIDHATMHQLPLTGPTVDLPAFVKRIHDFLSENYRKLIRNDDDDLLSGPSSPALERYREERAQIARLDRLEREGNLVPVDQMRDGIGRIAAILRSAGDTIQRQFGREAVQILYDALDEAGREVDRIFGEPSDGS